MNYSEEKADLAYERHPDTHLNQRRVWKTRGTIPDRYFDDSKIIRKRVQQQTQVEELKQDRLQLVLKSEKINATKVWEVAGVKSERWMLLDFLGGKVMLTEAERVQLTTEIQKLRAEIRNTLAKPPGLLRRKALVKLAQDVRLKKNPTFGKELGPLLTPHRAASPDELSKEQLQQIEERFALFLLETHL